jgi:hypothetical protein
MVTLAPQVVQIGERGCPEQVLDVIRHRAVYALIREMLLEA